MRLQSPSSELPAGHFVKDPTLLGTTMSYSSTVLHTCANELGAYNVCASALASSSHRFSSRGPSALPGDYLYTATRRLVIHLNCKTSAGLQ